MNTSNGIQDISLTREGDTISAQWKRYTGRAIEHARKKRKVGQRALARAINIHVSTIARIEHGEQAPSFSSIVLIADYLGITIDELIGRTPGFSESRTLAFATTVRQLQVGVNQLANELGLNAVKA